MRVPAVMVLALAAAPAAGQVVPKQVQLDDLGICLVRQAPAQSTKLLRTPLSSPAEREAAMVLVRGHDACIRGRGVSGHTGAIRGGVASAMFAHDPALTRRLASLPDAAPVRPAAAAGRALVIRYADCLVAAEPRTTATLLGTAVGTAAERAAFLGYGDALKGCMPEGVTYTVDITDVRNHAAAIAYQAVAPAGTN